MGPSAITVSSGASGSADGGGWKKAFEELDDKYEDLQAQVYKLQARLDKKEKKEKKEKKNLAKDLKFRGF